MRPLWTELPRPLRAEIERLVGGKVVTARDCPSGFSPGFASRLTLARGASRNGTAAQRRVFVKAIDAVAYPDQVPTYRAEGRIAAALPDGVPAPRLLGMVEDVRWIVLAFEDVDGVPPAQPWHPADLERVLAALHSMRDVATPHGFAAGHPRLGGWSAVEPVALRPHSQWAARNLARLAELEAEGLQAARGDALVHFDLYPINILLAEDRVAFVDWPHARLGVPVIDKIMLLSSAAADGLDPAPYLGASSAEPGFDAILAAHAGFLMAGALTIDLPALAAAKLHYGLGALAWLEHRLT